jgi:D-alanine-D-alanine ligase
LPDDHPDAESEREILESAGPACDILAAAGFRVSRLAVGRDPATLLEGVRRIRPDVVLNFFEGLADTPSTEYCVANLLGWLGVPFTGSTAEAICVTRSKPLSKLALSGAGLPTPDFFVVERLPDARLRSTAACLEAGYRREPLRWPLIVKAAHQDASVGIDQGSVVTAVTPLRKRVGLLLERYGPPVVVEQYVEGRELTVGVVETPEPRPLPLTEFVFKPRDQRAWPIVTYDAKWRVGSTDFQHTPFCERPAVEPELARRLQNLALRAYRVLGLRDYGRIDFRVPPAGEPSILEANANPDLSPQAALADALAAAGLAHADFLVRLVRRALERKSAPPQRLPVPEACVERAPVL